MKTIHILAIALALTCGARLVVADPERPADDKIVDKLIAELVKDLDNDKTEARHRAAELLLNLGRGDVRLTGKCVDRLILDLDSEKFEVRQKATELLMRAGKTAAEPLRRALQGKPSLETSNRVNTILRAITREPKDSKARKLAEELARPINLPDGFPANTSLQDALDYLSEKYGMTFIIDSNAFAAINVAKPSESQIELRKMLGISLFKVLRLMLGQVKGDDGIGDYILRDDYVEITTSKQVELEANPMKWKGKDRAFAPRVDAEHERLPLHEALRELAETSGVNIILDARATKAGWTAVTARMKSMPLDTAVELLADMADLKAVAVDRAIYVTTKENARAILKEQAERAMQEEKDLAPSPTP